MRPTAILQRVPGYTGNAGIGFATVRPPYKIYKSPHGPSYKIQPNVAGINAGRAMYFAMTAGAFGVVAGVAALQFFSEVPKVRTDIMEKIPFIGEYFHREIPPSDNPF